MNRTADPRDELSSLFFSNRKYALKKNVNDVLEPSEIIESERRIDLSLFSTVTKSK